MVQGSFALMRFAATSWYKPLAMCAEVPSSGYGQGTGAQEGSVPGEGTRMMWVWRPSPGGLLGSAGHSGTASSHDSMLVSSSGSSSRWRRRQQHLQITVVTASSNDSMLVRSSSR